MKWSIRILVLLEVVAMFAIISDGVRKIAYPEGATPMQALLAFLLLIVLEEILKVRQLFTEV